MFFFSLLATMIIDYKCSFIPSGAYGIVNASYRTCAAAAPPPPYPHYEGLLGLKCIVITISKTPLKLKKPEKYSPAPDNLSDHEKKSGANRSFLWPIY